MIIAFDVHGVLDTYEHFRTMLSCFRKLPDYSIYLISGSLFDSEMQNVLGEHNIKFDKYFSITQELLSANPKLINWVNGKPYAKEYLWDSMKAIICQREKVDILYDDSPKYGQYFRGIDTTYIEVHNAIWYESGRC